MSKGPFFLFFFFFVFFSLSFSFTRQRRCRALVYHSMYVSALHHYQGNGKHLFVAPFRVDMNDERRTMLYSNEASPFNINASVNVLIHFFLFFFSFFPFLALVVRELFPLLSHSLSAVSCSVRMRYLFCRWLDFAFLRFFFQVKRKYTWEDQMQIWLFKTQGRIIIIIIIMI